MIRSFIFWLLLALPLAAQTLDPTALTANFKSRADAGEDPAQLAQELGQSLQNPPAKADWFAPLVLQAELLADAQNPEAALTALTRAEGFFYTVPDADPMFLDWIMILQAMRMADLGQYGAAADQLQPLLPSVLVLFGQADHDALANAIPFWRAVMLVADPLKALDQLNQALDAYGAGNPAYAETLAQALLLPIEALGDDAVGRLITASAQSLLSLIADDRGQIDLAHDLSVQSVGLITAPVWDGTGPITLMPLPPDPAYTDMAFTILYPAATLAFAQNDYEAATALMTAMGPLSDPPARQVQLLSLQTMLAGASNDLDAMIDLATQRLTLLQTLAASHTVNRSANDSDDITSVTFEIDLLTAFRDMRNGKAVDITSLAAAATTGTALQNTAFTELLVTIGDRYLAPAQLLTLARNALDQRDKTTAALSDTARDAYLRAGRALTESWLNAAFSQTRATIATRPDLQAKCSDDTPQAFCVIWAGQ